MSGVSIKNLTRQHLKVLAGSAFSAIAERVLPDWEISLVFVGATRARALNKKLRGKSYVPNVLSYEVSEKSASRRSAEIIICPAIAIRQALAYNLQPTTYNLYLFIHGVLHIKGWVHGDKMEKCERKLLSLYEKTDSRRHRHRHIPGKNSGSGGTLR